jgi:hypothetical protein
MEYGEELRSVQTISSLRKISLAPTIFGINRRPVLKVLVLGP